MRELAICQTPIGEVAAVARFAQVHSVTDVLVRVGPLFGIDQSLLQNAFRIASAGTIAGEAILHLEETPIRVRCEECVAESSAAANHLTCGCCGNWQTQLVNGDELLLQRVVMRASHEQESIHV
jgi:hydrogenase nickel incorporation protein HypA/HybF